MKRTLLLLSTLFFSALGAFAQNDNAAPKLGFGIDLGAALPPHSTETPYTGGLHIMVESPINASRLSLIFKVGFTFYASSDASAGVGVGTYGSYSYSTGTVYSFVPIEIGAKYYIADKFYVEGDGGISLFVNRYPTNKFVVPIVAPGIGYSFAFNNSKNSIDLGLSYENRIDNEYSISDFSQISLHATFNVGL